MSAHDEQTAPPPAAAAAAAAAAAPTLDYANPKPFYSGAYRYRSRQGVISALVMLLCAVTFGSAGLFLAPLQQPDWPMRICAWGFRGAGAVSLAAAIHLLVRMALREQTSVRVTEHGIAYGGRSWAWGDIAEFGGLFDGMSGTGPGPRDGVWLAVRPRGKLLEVPIDLTPRLSADEYRELARAVAAHVAGRYPHVRVASEPRANGS